LHGRRPTGVRHEPVDHAAQQLEGADQTQQLKELRTRAETGNHHTADLLADQGRGRAPR
jgi:hypothetical protein